MNKYERLKKFEKQFYEKAKILHGKRYDYSLSNYTGNHDKTAIICLEHGSFQQSPHSHLAGHGCPKCAIKTIFNKRVKPQDDFIRSANKIHNNKFNYSKVNYHNSTTKIKIICPIHGEFEQRPYAHLNGQGCKHCHNILRKDIAPSWTLTNWINAGKRSTNFDGYKLYVIECFNDTERFIKVGRTFCTIKLRYSCSPMPYQYKILKVIQSQDAKYIYDLENRIKRKFKNLRYVPKIPFGGMNECFKF